MTKLLDINFNKGSYISSTGQIGINSNTTFLKLEKGYCLFCKNTQYVSLGTLNNVKTIIFGIKSKGDSTIIKDNTTIKLQITAGNLSGQDNAYVDNINISSIIFNKWQFIIVEFNNAINFTDLRIASSNNIYISDFKCYDYILSTIDKNNLYIAFLNKKSIVKLKSNFIYPKPSLISDLGLIAAYNMKPVGNMLPNIAFDNPANNYNAAQYNSNAFYRCQTVKNGILIRNNGTYVKFPITKTTGEYTLHCRLLVTITGTLFSTNSFGSGFGITVENNDIYIYGTGGTIAWNPVIISNKEVTLTLRCSITNKTVELFIDGISQGLKSGYYQSFENYLELGRDTNYGAWGYFYDFRMYNRLLSNAEIRTYHNKFASQITLKEDFSDYPISSSVYFLTNWKIKTGSWIIDELINNNSYLKKGTKILKSTSSSSIEKLSTIAYGTWEWDFNHATIGNNKAVRIISGTKNTNYYSFGFDSSSHLNVTRTGTNIYTSSNIYNTGLYHFKITRITSGVFNIYINNIFITSFTDTTYTSSNVINCSFTTNDYIANLKITKGIIL